MHCYTFIYRTHILHYFVCIRIIYIQHVAAGERLAELTRLKERLETETPPPPTATTALPPATSAASAPTTPSTTTPPLPPATQQQSQPVTGPHTEV